MYMSMSSSPHSEEEKEESELQNRRLDFVKEGGRGYPSTHIAHLPSHRYTHPTHPASRKEDEK